MDLYRLLVFLHVLGAVGMFAVWGIEAVALGQLFRARGADEARRALAMRRQAIPLGAVSMLTAIATGIWMMAWRWGPAPWLAAGIATLVLMIAVGTLFERRTAPRLTSALAAAEARLPAGLRDSFPELAASMYLRVGAGVALVALMTIRPGVAGSLAIVGAALAVGVALAARSRRRVPPSVASSASAG